MKIYFVSLGCDKNLVDSEVMLGMLTREGYTLTDDESQADIIVVNTCSFIHDAKQESVDTLLEMAEYKKSGSAKVLIATGCLAQRYQQEILDEIQEVLHKCGMSEIYIVNPYECFLLMCLLTDCPLAVFADIWEMSYEEQENA